MKTKPYPCISIQPASSQSRAPSFATPQRANIGRSLRSLALATALISYALIEAKGANILANDPEHGFKPTINVTNHSSESVVVIRSGGGSAFGKAPNPEKISANLLANLTGFPFTEIDEDMPVSLRIGGFAFSATLGDDASRVRNRDGTLQPFDPNKKSALFYLRDELPPLKPGGAPRLRTVGFVKLGWSLNRLAARLVVSDVAAAEADGILTPDAESYAQSNASVAFSCEKIPVEIAFGSATGSRTAYGRGRLTTTIRTLGSVRTGNLSTVSLHSLAMVGEADTTAPTLTAAIPAADEAPLGVISFNGTVADVAAQPLTGEVEPVTIQVRVNNVPLTGGTEDTDDFGLYIAQSDATGKRVFSVVHLPVAATQPGMVKVSVYATDASGNQSRVLESRVSVRGTTQGVPVVTTF